MQLERRHDHSRGLWQGSYLSPGMQLKKSEYEHMEQKFCKSEEKHN